MNDTNMVVMTGTIVQDPQLKEGQFGPYGRINVVCNETKKKKDGSFEEIAMFIYVDVSGKNAKTVTESGLRKGSKVMVTGILKLNNWEKDGEKKSMHTVLAHTLYPIEGKAKTAPEMTQAAPKPQQQYNKPTYQKASNKPLFEDDMQELPF